MGDVPPIVLLVVMLFEITQPFKRLIAILGLSFSSG